MNLGARGSLFRLFVAATAVWGLMSLVRAVLWSPVNPHGSAQGKYAYLRGVLSSSVQAQLRQDWAVYRTRLQEPEHAYCITEYTTRGRGSAFEIEVHRLSRAQTFDADPISITYDCGELPTLHSHPPTDCRPGKASGTWDCRPYPEDPVLCQPSNQDVETTAADRHRFGAIQCGIERVVFFMPVEPD